MQKTPRDAHELGVTASQGSVREDEGAFQPDAGVQPQLSGPVEGRRTATGKLVEGQTVTGWKAALAELANAYPERFNPYL